MDPFHDLLALADGEKHGYAIMQEVEDMTGGEIQIVPGTLYGSIKRMLAADLIEESDNCLDPTPDDDRRSDYRRTGFGRKVLHQETERMAGLKALARLKRVWSGAGFPDHLW